MLVRCICCNEALLIKAISLALLILMEGAACAEPVKVDPNGAGLPNWPAYSNAKPQAMHFVAGTAKAGPVVNEEWLNVLDSYFEWRRTGDTPAKSVPAGDNRGE